jgi:outer membrane biosynthesis protein TonB
MAIDYKLIKTEEENDKKGVLTSLTAHIALLALLYFMPNVQKPAEPIVAQIQVELPKDDIGGGPKLGQPDAGMNSTPTPGKPDPSPPSAPEPKPLDEPVKPQPSKPAVISKPTPPPPAQKPVQTTEDPNAAAIRRQQAEVKKAKEEAEYQVQKAARDKKQAQDAADARDAKAKADKQAQADAASRIGDRFRKPGGGGGNGSGAGNGGKPGNQGDPNGDASGGGGRGKGPGQADGFGNRGVRSAPKLNDSSQSSGKVVLKVCIDADGNVTSAVYRAQGSTTDDLELKEKAISNAKSYKFEPGSSDNCGTITYNFKVI